VPLFKTLHNTPSVPVATAPALGVTVTAAEDGPTPTLLVALTVQL
jgi:hypothetical protein